MLAPYYRQNTLEAGIDEAGRGCLAGPVVAAAVILPPDFDCPELTDSKQLSEKVRQKLRPIIESQALAWQVAIISPQRIDEVNILQATYDAMHEAVNGLSTEPALLLIDGNRFRPHRIESVCIVKGDAKFLAIAAASVLAKTYRDEIMESLHLQFPYYNWHSNKGYPTLAHKACIAEHGLCEHHRKTFRWQQEWTLF
jgi:ribonuclease HII